MSEKKIFDLQANKDDIDRALKLAEELQSIGAKYGFNVFQPGAMKELKMASILGHNWILSKKDADACSIDGSELYEYLSGTVKGAGQIDRVFKDDPGNKEQHEKHEQSMQRISRNKAFYLAYTNANTANPLDILRIYEVTPDEIRAEADRQLRNSRNGISHISFHEQFAKEHGKLVWEKK